MGIKEQDLGEIVEQHLIKGQPVNRLRLRPDHPEEERRQAFYNKLIPREDFTGDEAVKLAEQDGFSADWVELQINTGFLEAPEGERNLRVSNKGKARYGG